MARVLIVAFESKEINELARGLARTGLNFSLASPEEDIISRVSQDAPGLIILEISEALSPPRAQEFSQEIKGEMTLPVMALVPRRMLFSITSAFPADDFIVTPCDEREFVLRVRRLIHTNSNNSAIELVKGGDLVVDTVRCEVTLGGNRIDLTYREYELLKFLMSNKGRVFTRETLLNRVWGYDYYGGDRTVDVHIRRLRSKIEIGGKTFIETVRNIGYRFRDDI